LKGIHSISHHFPKNIAQKPVAEALHYQLQDNDINAVIDFYHQLRNSDAVDEYNFDVEEINMLGQYLLGYQSTTIGPRKTTLLRPF
jgi:hypothetical protein